MIHGFVQTLRALSNAPLRLSGRMLIGSLPGLLSCSENSVVGASRRDQSSNPVAVAAVLLTPSLASVVVGDSVSFAVTLVDAAGDTLRGRTVTWTHRSSVVAALQPTGVAVGNVPGIDTIYATGQSVTGTAVLEVDGKPEPMPTGTIYWHDGFDSGPLGETLTDSLLLQPYNLHGESFMHADPGSGLDGTGAMRIDWRRAAGCDDQSHLIERAIPPTADVYAQFSVRYTPGFIFDWTESGQSPCTGNAKKLFFLYPASGSGTSRFDFISENHTLGMGGDYDHPLFQQFASPMTVEQLGDGKWHRITLHVRQSSTPTTPDGFIDGWIDGEQRWRVAHWASGSSGGWQYFQLPSTFNQGSPVNQSEWLDDLTVWTP